MGTKTTRSGPGSVAVKLEDLVAAKSVAPSEHEEQAALITQANLSTGRYPALRLLYAIPNGGGRSKAEAGRQAAEGVRSGVPDLCLPVSRSGFLSLYVEMKRGGKSDTRGKCSIQQRAYIAELRAHGNAVAICYSQAEAWAAIMAYLKGDGVRPWREERKYGEPLLDFLGEES